MFLKKYNLCVYCKSKNLKKEKNQYSKENFYTKAIKSDLKISDLIWIFIRSSIFVVMLGN